MRGYLLAAITCLVFSGCGGGGAKSGGATPPVAAQPAQQTQRAVAGQSLAGVQATGLMLNYGGSGAGSAQLAFKRHVVDQAARRVAQAYRFAAGARVRSGASPAAPVYGACSDGTESAQNVVSSTEIQVYAKTFYDAACQNLFSSSYFDVTASSSTAATASGNEAEYSASGAIVSYQTVQLSLTGIGAGSGTFSVLVTDAASQTASQLGTAGIACGIAPTAINCGFGLIVHSQTLDQDEGETLGIAFSATTANNTITVPMRASGTEYTGALNALSIAAGTFPAWGISGGTTIDTASLTGQIVYNMLGLPLSGSMTVTDAADNETSVVTFKGTQIDGVVTQTSTGTKLGSFSVNQYGTGTITYADGKTGEISQWQVLS